MNGKFEVFVGKHCWKLADRLSVMVCVLGLRCWLADWRIRDATAKVVSCSAGAVPSAVRRASLGVLSSTYRRKNTVLAATYSARTYWLRLFKAVNGQTSVLIYRVGRLTGHDRLNIRPLQAQTFDRWQNLTGQIAIWPENLIGHIAYRLFDRLPVKYLVPFL